MKQTNSKMNQVDLYFQKIKNWKQEFQILRSIVLEIRLQEEIKWGQPCYTLNGQNIFLIHGFKEYFAILFFKGALLKDPKKILIQQTKFEFLERIEKQIPNILKGKGLND
ncbi:hypothetical protein EHQ31_08415 [Leptospira montravelensis]|uniref:YdhG-like domain-containing protein n=1 Tax=Leptospira montravelensis TaxID=2484961 RepID=A0ABY2LRI3_9LEPT|nr:DUF1801 domain-containing protein [Leptospira montravelensis]TGK86445.1 hypothetical protein EHQ19_00570 [Leptospira montravelensis]TGL02701.1 hypothetical protein EHQ31_08415 [Leptospira montravelensis]